MIKTFFPNHDFKAYLFDFDGTVADTMPGHWQAWNHALSQYDITFTREQHQAWAGRPTREIVRLLSEMHKVELSADDILTTKDIYYSKSLHMVKGIVPVVEIIEAAYKKIPMAIVTGSRRKAVEATLDILKMRHFFDVLVCAEDYVHGKPAPDCFLKAAEFFNLPPAECLVFEDGQLGLESAKAAGMEYLKIEEHQIGQHRITR